ncbi:MAG: hypothetical protein IVW56_04535 [Candidatus Binataceae bacterium]|nr:hypothetical protein [Candidatus Binataceae bacterium]
MNFARSILHRHVLMILAAAEPIGAREELLQRALQFGRKRPATNHLAGALAYLSDARLIDRDIDALHAPIARLTEKGAAAIASSRDRRLTFRPFAESPASTTTTRAGRDRTRGRRALTWPKRS